MFPHTMTSFWQQHQASHGEQLPIQQHAGTGHGTRPMVSQSAGSPACNTQYFVPQMQKSNSTAMFQNTSYPVSKPVVKESPLDLSRLPIPSDAIERTADSPLDLSLKTRKRIADTTDSEDDVLIIGEHTPAKRMCMPMSMSQYDSRSVESQQQQRTINGPFTQALKIQESLKQKAQWLRQQQRKQQQQQQQQFHIQNRFQQNQQQPNHPYYHRQPQPPPPPPQQQHPQQQQHKQQQQQQSHQQQQHTLLQRELQSPEQYNQLQTLEQQLKQLRSSRQEVAQGRAVPQSQPQVNQYTQSRETHSYDSKSSDLIGPFSRQQHINTANIPYHSGSIQTGTPAYNVRNKIAPPNAIVNSTIGMSYYNRPKADSLVNVPSESNLTRPLIATQCTNFPTSPSYKGISVIQSPEPKPIATSFSHSHHPRSTVRSCSDIIDISIQGSNNDSSPVPSHNSVYHGRVGGLGNTYPSISTSTSPFSYSGNSIYAQSNIVNSAGARSSHQFAGTEFAYQQQQQHREQQQQQQHREQQQQQRQDLDQNVCYQNRYGTLIKSLRTAPRLSQVTVQRCSPDSTAPVCVITEPETSPGSDTLKSSYIPQCSPVLTTDVQVLGQEYGVSRSPTNLRPDGNRQVQSYRSPSNMRVGDGVVSRNTSVTPTSCASGGDSWTSQMLLSPISPVNNMTHYPSNSLTTYSETRTHSMASMMSYCGARVVTRTPDKDCSVRIDISSATKTDKESTVLLNPFSDVRPSQRITPNEKPGSRVSPFEANIGCFNKLPTTTIPDLIPAISISSPPVMTTNVDVHPFRLPPPNDRDGGGSEHLSTPLSISIPSDNCYSGTLHSAIAGNKSRPFSATSSSVGNRRGGTLLTTRHPKLTSKKHMILNAVNQDADLQILNTSFAPPPSYINPVIVDDDSVSPVCDNSGSTTNCNNIKNRRDTLSPHSEIISIMNSHNISIHEGPPSSPKMPILSPQLHAMESGPDLSSDPPLLEPKPLLGLTRHDSTVLKASPVDSSVSPSIIIEHQTYAAKSVPSPSPISISDCDAPIQLIRESVTKDICARWIKAEQLTSVSCPNSLDRSVPSRTPLSSSVPDLVGVSMDKTEVGSRIGCRSQSASHSFNCTNETRLTEHSSNFDYMHRKSKENSPIQPNDSRIPKYVSLKERFKDWMVAKPVGKPKHSPVAKTFSPNCLTPKKNDHSRLLCPKDKTTHTVSVHGENTADTKSHQDYLFDLKDQDRALLPPIDIELEVPDTSIGESNIYHSEPVRGPPGTCKAERNVWSSLSLGRNCATRPTSTMKKWACTSLGEHNKSDKKCYNAPETVSLPPVRKKNHDLESKHLEADLRREKARVRARAKRRADVKTIFRKKRRRKGYQRKSVAYKRSISKSTTLAHSQNTDNIMPDLTWEDLKSNDIRGLLLPGDENCLKLDEKMYDDDNYGSDTGSHCKLRRRSILSELANSDGYVEEAKRHRCTTDLNADPSMLGREQRALQRAMKKFDEMETPKTLGRNKTSPKQLKRQTNVQQKAQELRMRALGRPTMRQAMRNRQCTLLVSPHLVDNEPPVRRVRTRTQTLGPKARMYHRDRAYEKALKKDEKLKAWRRACRYSNNSISKEDYNFDESDQSETSDDNGCWEVRNTVQGNNDVTRTRRHRRGKGRLMMKLLWRPGSMSSGMKDDSIEAAAVNSANRGTGAFRRMCVFRGKSRRRRRRYVFSIPRRCQRRNEELQLQRQALLETERLQSLETENADDEGDGGDENYRTLTEPPELRRLNIDKNSGETLLHRAARAGKEDVTLYCLRTQSVDVNSRDHAGYTPLHESCVRGYLPIARALLEFGAEVNCSSQDGIRPLHDAVENNHIEIVRLLLSYGADPHLTTYSGKCPVSMARSSSMKLLFSGYLADLNGSSDPEVETPWPMMGSFITDYSSASGYDVLADVPSDCDDDTESHVEWTDDKPPVSYNFSLRENHRCQNYVLLNDLLETSKFSRAEFFRTHAANVSLISASTCTIRRRIRESALHTFPNLPTGPISSEDYTSMVALDDLKDIYAKKGKRQLRSCKKNGIHVTSRYQNEANNLPEKEFGAIDQKPEVLSPCVVLSLATFHSPSRTLNSQNKPVSESYSVQVKCVGINNTTNYVNNTASVHVNNKVNVNNTASVHVNNKANVDNAACADVINKANVNKTSCVDVNNKTIVNNTACVDVNNKANVNNMACVEVINKAKLNNTPCVDVINKENVNNSACSDVNNKANVNNTACSDVNNKMNVNNTACSDVNNKMNVDNAACADVNNKANVNNTACVDVNHTANVLVLDKSVCSNIDSDITKDTSSNLPTMLCANGETETVIFPYLSHTSEGDVIDGSAKNGTVPGEGDVT